MMFSIIFFRQNTGLLKNRLYSGAVTAVFMGEVARDTAPLTAIILKPCL